MKPNKVSIDILGIRHFNMVLSLKNRELDETARELAAIMGSSITDALLESAKRELQRRKSLRAKNFEAKWARIQEIQRAIAAIPEREHKLTDDEILGYDEFGIPSL
jgi:antitoxin VapB